MTLVSLLSGCRHEKNSDPIGPYSPKLGRVALLSWRQEAAGCL